MTVEKKPENPLLKKTLFGKEKNSRRPYTPIEGSWESVLVGLKDDFGEDVMGVGDSDHWIDIDEKRTMSLEQACFQYYLAGRGHRTLAEIVVNKKRHLGNMSEDEREDLTGRIANKLYEKYPARYKLQVPR